MRGGVAEERDRLEVGGELGWDARGGVALRLGRLGLDAWGGGVCLGGALRLRLRLGRLGVCSDFPAVEREGPPASRVVFCKGSRRAEIVNTKMDLN